MNYKFIELEELSVIGIKYELSKSLSNNIYLAQKYWCDFNKKLSNNKLYLGSNWTKFAFVEKVDNKIYYYVAIPKRDYIPTGFLKKIIQKNNYLMVEHIGNMNRMKDTIDYIYKEIIPKNGINIDNSQLIYFEKYDCKFHWNRQDSIIEIYIPIK